MASEWQVVPLGDLYDFSSGLSKPRSEFGFGFAFVTFKDVLDNYFLPATLSALVNSSDKEQSVCSVRRGDVFLTRTSETQEDLGMSCVALKDYPGATFNGFTKRLRPKRGAVVIPEYAGYYFRGPRFRQAITAMSSLSTRASLNNDMLERLDVVLPPPSIQATIGRILKALDDKIELNRRMNATLEAMSRAIFKSWFVDFEPVRQKAAGKQPVGMDAETAALFPDSFEDSEIGEVPKGWGMTEVRDFLSLSRESVDPSEHPAETFNHYSIPAFDGGCWPSPDVGAEIKSQKLLVAPGSVLISKLNPRTPRVWIPQARHNRRPVASTEFLVAVPNDTSGVGVPFLFCFASSESVVEYLACHASGTSNSHQRVRPDDFLSLHTALATNAVLGAFDKCVGPLLQRSSHARSESRALAALRDTLLPKLLSGEICVSEAEKAIA